MAPSNKRVAYRLLDTNDQCDAACDELESPDYLEQQLAATASGGPHFPQAEHALSTIWHRVWEIRLMRALLFLATVLLVLVFLISCLTNNKGSPGNRSALPSLADTGAGPSSSYSAQIGSEIYAELQSSGVPIPAGALKPPVRPYFSYLSSMLEEHNSRANGSPSPDLFMDDLHFPQASDLTQSANGPVAAWWRLGSRYDDKYVTVSNYIRAIKSFSYSNSVTLATQATTEFMHHSLELCKRWDGPISIAVYTPGVELPIALTLVKFMRHCLPDLLSACIRDRITWHLVYDRHHGPLGKLGFPRDHLDHAAFPLFVDQDQCPKYSGPEPSDLIQQFHQDLMQRNNLNNTTNYRKQHSLLYPINVPRNVARLAARTKYLISSDIELYPSVNLVQGFISYISKHNVSELYGCSRFDFTLPIFEVDSSVEAPKTKPELVQLFLKGKAVFFHKYVCDLCQKFPHRDQWLHTDVYGRENYTADTSQLVIFDTTLRNRTMNSWEPIFIGTNDDPLFDDRLTWEGRRDKMGQMYEMCLLDYRQLILGNAFLVHAPGVKHIDKSDVLRRLEYIKHNNAIYDATMLELRKSYSNSVNINRC